MGAFAEIWMQGVTTKTDNHTRLFHGHGYSELQSTTAPYPYGGCCHFSHLIKINYTDVTPAAVDPVIMTSQFDNINPMDFKWNNLHM